MVENPCLEKLKDLYLVLDGAENSVYLRLIYLSLFILCKIPASQSFPDNERKRKVRLCGPVDATIVDIKWRCKDRASSEERHFRKS